MVAVLMINHTLKISYMNAATRFFRKQDSNTATLFATSKACGNEGGTLIATIRLVLQTILKCSHFGRLDSRASARQCCRRR
jgi:hypothetical protein